LGFRLVQGLSSEAAEVIVQARQQRGFHSFTDFTHRTKLGRATLRRLAEADCFRSLGSTRRLALWESLAQQKEDCQRPLFAAQQSDDPPPRHLPKMPLEEEVYADYRTCGLSLKAHPLSFHRTQLNRLGIVPARQLGRLANNRQVRVAGLVLLRQRPSTAKGITFVTLEDETGTANLVLHQTIWNRYYHIARRCPAWIAHGRLESRDSVIHVVVNRLEDLSQKLAGLQTKSRDFR
jgi:error-prone DNA polymerase